MTHLLTLALPNFTETFDITTDTFGVAIGAVVSQHDKPIAFFSKKLCDRNQNNSTYIRELYAITESIKNGANTYWDRNSGYTPITTAYNISSLKPSRHLTNTNG